MNQYIYENHDVKGLVVSEAKGSTLAEGVLAKVKGPSFFLDGFSRNGRFYPKKLWENALKNPETKSALTRGLMFGCIGHPKDYSLDELLESGKVSHKVTDIYIDKQTGEGIAEYEILDTPAGRILNTVLRSGSEMYVSTRAFGGFSNETKSKDGKKYKVLDVNNFVIESVDFVIQPGFLETNPTLVESLMEDFMELKEKDEAHHIECEDGLCSLNLEGMNEVNEDEEPKIEEEANVLDKAVLEKLNKDELITMLENVVNENNLLTKDAMNEEDTGNSDDMMVSAKLMMNYVSYVEVLTKMVRYNVEYEKYYDQLIEFLDKDAKLTTDDMTELDKICDEILKEKDVEESIIHACERIKELAEKINDDGEKDDKEKEDKEGKTESPTKKDDEEDTSATVKAKGESLVDFMWNLKERIEIQKEVVYEEDTEKVDEMASQVLRLKEATVALTKNLEEALNQTPEKEIVTETKIEFKIPDDINEKFVSMNETVESLKEAKAELETKLNEYQASIEKSSETYGELVAEKEALEEAIETDKGMFREILEDKEKEKIALEEAVEEQKQKTVEVQEVLKKTNKKVDKVSEKLNETTAKFYSMYHKLELPLVEKLMELHTDEVKLKEALIKEEKLNNRRAPVAKIDLPEYKPKDVSRAEKKSKFLENLTR